MTEWRFSYHARRRMEEMGVTEEEVLAALDEPEVAYPQHPKIYPDREVHAAGRVAACVVVDEGVVVTVVWRTSTTGRVDRSLDGRPLAE